MRAAVSRTLIFVALVLPGFAWAAAPGAGEPRAAQSSPAEWLERMATAMRGLDYQGSFIFEHEGRVDALRVFHAGGEPERERLVGLTGPRSEIVRDGNSVTSIQSGSEPTVFTSGTGSLPLHGLTSSRIASLSRHYNLLFGGEDRVAGYRAQRIDVVPRDAYRYGYRLWLERDSHLLLRFVALDQDGRSLAHFMFVSLEIGARPRPGDLLPSGVGKLRAPADEVAVDDAAYWRISKLPPGFVLIGRRHVRQAPDGAEHLTWSDGLASASLYIEPRGAATQRATTLARGTLNLYATDHGSWRVTALGNVPALTVEQLVHSLEPLVQPR
jgi:sigma-E factor negative regulatory protein RseB